MQAKLKNILIFTFCAFSLSASLYAGNNGFRMWIAAKFLDKIITNHDVENYLERSVLDDAQRSALFLKAGKNYSAYKKLLRETTKDQFEDALRFMLYNKALEFDATNGKKVTEWVAFRIKPSDFYKQVTEMEDRVLKPLLDKRLGIVKSREQFGQYLIDNNYPHKLDESATDVYFRWYNDQKYRLKNELRANEAKKYEAITAIKHDRELYIRPMEQGDFFKDNKAFVEENLNGKVMSVDAARKIITANPDVRLVIKDAHYLSLNSAPLARFKETDATKYANAKARAVEGIKPSLSIEKINKLLSYLEKADAFAKKYKSIDKLRELSAEMKRRFNNGGTYSHSMMERLYELAALQLEEKLEIHQAKDALRSVLANSFADVLAKIELDETYARERVKNDDGTILVRGTSKLLFEDVIRLILNESSAEHAGAKYRGYLKSALLMSAWAVKFDAKKFSYNDLPEVLVEYRPYMDWDTQKKIVEHLKMKKFAEYLKKFREQTLRYNIEGLFSVDVDGDMDLNGRRAYDWLIEANK